MAEQTPSSNGDSSDFLRKRTHQEKQSGDNQITAGQRSLPPKRGLLKRSKGSAAPGRTDPGRRVMRTPISREQTGPRPHVLSATSPILTPPLPPSLQSPPPIPSKHRPAQAKGGRPESARPRSAPVNPNVVKTQQKSSDRLEKRLIDAEERRKSLVEKEQQLKEIKAAKVAERERKAQLRAEVQKKAEEERVQKQKEFELRKAEAQRIKLEQEAEAKRLEEVRLIAEKEEEMKRLAEEKIFQEKKGQRIFQMIESCQGKMSEKEQQLARTIADEMVKRNIHWEGYISLHSGIGGSMLS